jgi:hypothetical protein
MPRQPAVGVRQIDRSASLFCLMLNRSLMLEAKLKS